MSTTVEAGAARSATFPRAGWVVAAWFPLGLVIDATGPMGFAVTTSATWLVFALVWWAADRDTRRVLLVCVAWATFGELVLTEVLGLYHYRVGFLPPFVPPGHALLFQLGVWTAGVLPNTARRPLTWAAVGVGLATVAAFGDLQSLVFLTVFVVLVRTGPSPALYGTMFFLALGLELVGTAIGTWVWAPRDPWLGIPTTNPPVAAGVFYCLLDALTLGARGRRTAAA